MHRRDALATALVIVGMLFEAACFVPGGSHAGDNEVTIWGSDADITGGDWQYSPLYADGIQLSPGSGSGWAVWYFTIDPLPRTFYLSITTRTTDQSGLGDGADLYLYNIFTGVYDHIARLNKGVDVVSVSAVVPLFYVEGTGQVKVYLLADWLDDTHIDYVRLNWGLDDNPPVNPWYFTSDPVVDCYTSDNVIQVQWFGTIDYENAVGGYSINWSNKSVDAPDTTIDTILPSTISPPLADGAWYLHVRCVDSVGNWNDESFAIGPFLIDCCSPGLVILTPADESTSEDDNITIYWQGDDSCSGIDRYEVSVDGGPWVDVGLATDMALANLSSSYHTVWVRAYDGAGNSVTKVVDFAVRGDAATTEDVIVWLLLPLALLIVIAILATALMLSHRKRRLKDDGSDDGNLED